MNDLIERKTGEIAKDTNVPSNDCISRQAAIDAVGYYSLHNGDKLLFADKPLKELPSAQPPTDEWCTDCKEYDKEKHCCPRWNRVIRQTLADAQRWIPVTERLPEENVNVLVWFEYFRYGDYNRLFQTYGLSYVYCGKWSGFINGESGWRQMRVIAWMPLPEPYKEGQDDKN